MHKYVCIKNLFYNTFPIINDKILLLLLGGGGGKFFGRGREGCCFILGGQNFWFEDDQALSYTAGRCSR